MTETVVSICVSEVLRPIFTVHFQTSTFPGLSESQSIAMTSHRHIIIPRQLRCGIEQVKSGFRISLYEGWKPFTVSLDCVLFRAEILEAVSHGIAFALK